MMVVAWTVVGQLIHVFFPSLLYCHSYAARLPALGATSCTDPDTRPVFTVNVRGAGPPFFLTAIPALSMIDAPCSASASALAWTWPRSCSRRICSARRLWSRVATVPTRRVSVAASACSSARIAPSTVASGGRGEGNDGLFVTALRMLRAYEMRRGTWFLGSFRTARQGDVLFVTVVMRARPRLSGSLPRATFGARCGGERGSAA